MSTTTPRSTAGGDADDIIRLLDEPVSASLCPQSSTVKGRRVPTCALIMLSVVAAIGVLAYGFWPRGADAPQPWKTRAIILPNDMGIAYHRDRILDSFFGTYERRIDISGVFGSGSVMLPTTGHGGSTYGDVVWREDGARDGHRGPWLEINDEGDVYLIDMRKIALYRIHNVDGDLCAVGLDGPKPESKKGADAVCRAVPSDRGPAVNISEWARHWSSEHMGMLDRRPLFAAGESAVSRISRTIVPGERPSQSGKYVTADGVCNVSGPRHMLRVPPRLEYIGVSEGSSPPPCHGPLKVWRRQDILTSQANTPDEDGVRSGARTVID